jgi:transcriptional regulator with XRE-family HTH domain
MSENSKQILLGDTLARLRRRKGISQARLAACMGWRGTSPIVEIEKGRRLPESSTIKRWIQCVDGSFTDIHYLMGLAGSIPPTKMPSLNQIKAVLSQEIEKLENLPYPAYIIDYRTTFWAMNSATTALTGKTSLEDLLKVKSTVLDFIWNSSFDVRNQLIDPNAIGTIIIKRFIAFNLYRRHEDFFLAYPKSMNGRLGMSSEDYLRFEQIWNEVIYQDYMLNSALPKWSLKFTDDVQGNFRITAQTYPALGNLFDLIIHVPEPDNDQQNIEEINKYLLPFRQKKAVTLWDVTNAQILLDEY